MVAAACAPLAQVRRDRVDRPRVPVGLPAARHIPVDRAVVPLVAALRVPVAVRVAQVAVVRVVPVVRTVAPAAVRVAQVAVVSALEGTVIVAGTGEERQEHPRAPDPGRPPRQSQQDPSPFPSR